MKNATLTSLLIAVMLIFFACDKAPVDAPEVITKITGKITKQDNTPLAGVAISTLPSTQTATTDNNGNYEIKLAAGTYAVNATKTGYKAGSVQVTVAEGQSATGSLQLIEQTPELSVSATELNYGTTETTKTMQVSNTGIGTLNCTLSTDLPWVTISQSSCAINAAEIKNITLTINKTGLAYGNYNPKVTINSNGGSKVIGLIVNVPNPNQPFLTVSSLELNFGTLETQQNLTIKNSGNGELTYSIAKTQSWLTINNSSGTLAGGVQKVIGVTINRQNIAAGDYTDRLTVTTNGGTAYVDVKMSVAANPVLAVNTTMLDFGADAAQLAFQVSNSGNGSLNWSATANQSWLTLAPASGTNTGTINATVNRSGLTFGSYSGEITIVSNGGNKVIPVKMIYRGANVAPTVDFTISPASGEVGVPFTFNAAASADDYTPAESLLVRWKFDAMEAFTAWSSDKQVTHTYAAAGSKSVTLEVKDTSGKIGNKTKTVTVNNVTLGNWYLIKTHNVTLNAVDALSANFMVTGGEKNSTDNKYYTYFFDGTNWTTKEIAHSVDKIKIISPNDIWALNTDIYGSADAVSHYDGSGWVKDTQIPSISSSTHAGYYSISAFNSNFVMVGGYSNIYKYDGAAWTTIAIDQAGKINKIEIFSENDIWALGSGGAFHYNGVGWIKKQAVSFNDGAVINENDIWRIDGSDDPSLYHWNGTQWTDDVIPGSYGNTSGFSIVVPNNIWAVSTSSSSVSSIFHYDGGSFTSVQTPTSQSLLDIKMVSANSGYAVGWNGVVVRYVK